MKAYITPDSQAELDAMTADMDRARTTANKARVASYMITLHACRERLSRSPLKFAYEIRNLDRMERLCNLWGYIPESVKRIIREYRNMTD